MQEPKQPAAFTPNGFFFLRREGNRRTPRYRRRPYLKTRGMFHLAQRHLPTRLRPFSRLHHCGAGPEMSVSGDLG